MAVLLLCGAAITQQTHAQPSTIDFTRLASFNGAASPAAPTREGRILAVHLLADAGDDAAAAAIRDFTGKADTLAGVSHVFVRAGDRAAVEAWSRTLGEAGSLVFFDEGGSLTSSLNAAKPLSLLLSADRDPVRIESSQGALAWKAIADAVASATRNEALSHYNLPKGSTLAVEGYDVVAYFKPGKAIKGSEKFESKYHGVTYRFSTAENRKAFAAAPEDYLPTYGGWCASAMGAKAEKVEIDPKNFKVEHGRLFLFYKDLFSNALTDWNKRSKEWEPAADTNWKRVSGESPVLPGG